MNTALVIATGPGAGVGRLGEWLDDAGLAPTVVRPDAGDPLPELPGEQAALVVLGTGTAADPSPVARLLVAAVEAGLPTLAIGTGARLLATSHGGTVEPPAAGPAAGPALVARRDVAEADPLFARVPFTPDVVAWHTDEITALPPEAVLLAASTSYPHQAFRLGPAAWGLQFHIEPDLALVEQWAAADPGLLRHLGRTPQQLIAACAAVMDDLFEVWQPFATRFAALARGEATGVHRQLPLLGN